MNDLEYSFYLWLVNSADIEIRYKMPPLCVCFCLEMSLDLTMDWSEPQSSHLSFLGLICQAIYRCICVSLEMLIVQAYMCMCTSMGAVSIMTLGTWPGGAWARE